MRHRLTRGGNRRLNALLDRIAVIHATRSDQARACQQTQAKVRDLEHRATAAPLDATVAARLAVLRGEVPARRRELRCRHRVDAARDPRGAG